MAPGSHSHCINYHTTSLFEECVQEQPNRATPGEKSTENQRSTARTIIQRIRQGDRAAAATALVEFAAETSIACLARQVMQGHNFRSTQAILRALCNMT